MTKAETKKGDAAKTEETKIEGAKAASLSKISKKRKKDEQNEDRVGCKQMPQEDLSRDDGENYKAEEIAQDKGKEIAQDKGKEIAQDKKNMTDFVEELKEIQKSIAVGAPELTIIDVLG